MMDSPDSIMDQVNEGNNYIYTTTATNKGIRIDSLTTMRMEIRDLKFRIERQAKIIVTQKREILKYKNLLAKKSYKKDIGQLKDLIIPIQKLPELYGKDLNDPQPQLWYPLLEGEDCEMSSSIPNLTQIHIQVQDPIFNVKEEIQIDHFDEEIQSKSNENSQFMDFEDFDDTNSPIFIEKETQNEDAVTEIDEETTFKCEYCDDQVFNSTKEFNIHTRKDHKLMQDIKCSICEQISPNFYTYERHMNIHWEKYKCSFCGKYFGKHYLLNKHISTCHKLKKGQKCDQCDQVCVNIASLNRHIKYIHQKIQTLHCSKCPKTFSRPDNLKLHQEIHNSHNIKLKCSTCNQIFNTSGRLRNHIKFHHENYQRKSKKKPKAPKVDGEIKSGKCKSRKKVGSTTTTPRPRSTLNRIELKCPHESCSTNSRKYIGKFSLQRHILRFHEKDRKMDFKCDFEGCEWKFHTKSELGMHSKIHLSVEEKEALKRQFICSICGALFTSTRGHLKHLRNHQNENNTGEFACDFEGCWRKFDTFFSLKVHKRHHFKRNPKVNDYLRNSNIRSKKLLEKRKDEKKAFTDDTDNK